MLIAIAVVVLLAVVWQWSIYLRDCTVVSKGKVSNTLTLVTATVAIVAFIIFASTMLYGAPYFRLHMSGFLRLSFWLGLPCSVVSALSALFGGTLQQKLSRFAIGVLILMLWLFVTIVAVPLS